MTKYRHNSHADAILTGPDKTPYDPCFPGVFGVLSRPVTKFLEGWKHDGGSGPALKLASMYVDQFPDADVARKMSKKYDVPIFDSIEKAVTVGGKTLPVNGVLSIGAHGDYPTNKLGQKLHPPPPTY